MRIEIIVNRGCDGKRNRKYPWIAMIDGQCVGHGETKTRAMASAVANLYEAYEYHRMPLQVVTANDGTLFIARESGYREIRIEHKYRENGKWQIIGCRHEYSIADSGNRAVREELERFVRNYNEAIGEPAYTDGRLPERVA